jgi:hypothetical protein
MGGLEFRPGATPTHLSLRRDGRWLSSAVRLTNRTATLAGPLRVDGHTIWKVNWKAQNTTVYPTPAGRVPGVSFLPKCRGRAATAQSGRRPRGKSCTFRDKTCICVSRLALPPAPRQPCAVAEVFRNTLCLHGCRMALPRTAEDGASRAGAK